MAAPTATRNSVRYRLIDTDATNPLLVDATTLDEAIANAVNTYSADRPRSVTADVTGNGTPFYPLVGTGALLASWVDFFSRINSIEYPVAAVSASYTPTYLTEQDDWTYYETAAIKYLRLLSVSPSASETLRVNYTALHTHTSVTDTVPSPDNPALCDLAAHFACLALATKMSGSSDSIISADSVGYRDSQLRYRQQAEDWLKSYRGKLGIPEKGDVAGASANADWDQQLQSGWPFMTHNPRRR